jgi:arginine N-succinyltransferase
MHLLRPIAERDLAGLVTLAQSTGGGLTTLPADEEFLRDRIDDSLRAFSPRVRRPGGEFYLFALEDLASGEVVGTSGIAARVGGFDPFYSYEIRPERFAHAPLGIEKDVPVLHLRQVHRGPSELCSLYLRPDQRRGGLGRMLSLGRLVFVAGNRRRFDDVMIAELRGYIDQQGLSPFWEAVGRKFFEFDFYAMDLLSGLGNKAFIADLMPKYPIYVTLLPADVQAAIGRVHHDTRPARSMLEAEGFLTTSEVDIFDAGPQLRARVEELRTIRQSRVVRLEAVADLAGTEPGWMIANGQLDFRLALAPAEFVDDGRVRINAATADALRVSPGDSLTLAPVR